MKFSVKDIWSITKQSFADFIDTKVFKLSAALAFLFDPAVLILDEPTAGLDPLASELLKEKIIAEK